MEEVLHSDLVFNICLRLFIFDDYLILCVWDKRGYLP
jgi:hypothetical protein